ncbi:MAG: hypothetical protein AMJ59_04875 [Gammaproteobacteria bacterium SG8_31]|jgi:uncharacterized membrane protein YkoI|nr:MAG: hypothetical protein AMJ59_04875 [Gammaproteobacteria bacterium SG8_31]
MPHMFRPLLTAAALAAFLAIAPSQVALSRAGPASAPAWIRTASEGVSLDEAIRRVRDVYGDVTVLKAETRGAENRRVHHIKFLTESGRVKTVMVDARTGDIR